MTAERMPHKMESLSLLLLRADCVQYFDGLLHFILFPDFPRTVESRLLRQRRSVLPSVRGSWIVPA